MAMAHIYHASGEQRLDQIGAIPDDPRECGARENEAVVEPLI
jgi:hypothetical protein